MHSKKTVAIWWVKRDFRLSDNQALHQALEVCPLVLPVFLFEDVIENGPDWGRFHHNAINSAVASLGGNLQHYGSELITFDKSPIEALKLVNHKLAVHGLTVAHIFSHEETGLNHTYARDKAFSSWCKKSNISWTQYTCNGVIRGPIYRDNWDRSITDYLSTQVFEIPHEKLALCFPDLLRQLFHEHSYTRALKERNYLPKSQGLVSENRARNTLKKFLSNSGTNYWGGISSMNRAPTSCSRLSVSLAWGALSLRAVFQQTINRQIEVKDNAPFYNENEKLRWTKSLQNFKSRLFWHAHFVQKLEDEVEMEFQAVNKAFRVRLPYVYEDDDSTEYNIRLQAWLNGTTGFPAIDAAMRYL